MSEPAPTPFEKFRELAKRVVSAPKPPPHKPTPRPKKDDRKTA